VRTIALDGMLLTPLWHCFGNERHLAGADTIVGLLAMSGTNVLPINTHRLGRERDRAALEHGFGGVAHDDLGAIMDLTPYVKLLNINLRTSVDAAVLTAQIAVEMTGERVIKLEVLDHTYRQSLDQPVLEAARRLLRWEPTLILLPLLSCSVAAGERAIQTGCKLLRVMGSPIGSRAGIAEPAVFEEICTLPVPVVLDGGVGHPCHLNDAAQLGAAGVLVNSVLFDDGRDPVEVMREYAETARRFLGHGVGAKV
jgi:thiazole synthase